MQEFPALSWMQAFCERVNTDPEMAVVGDWFTTSIALGFGDTRYVLRVDRGQIVDVNAAPRIDSRSVFGFRAPLEVWHRFVGPNPPPLFHDFFAMLMRVPEFVLEGDGLVAMQNARALHRMMNLMRSA